MPEGTPEEVIDSREKPQGCLNTLEVKTVQRKAQREDRITEGSMKLCQEGIE
jgi:hypothetical protein